MIDNDAKVYSRLVGGGRKEYYTCSVGRKYQFSANLVGSSRGRLMMKSRPPYSTFALPTL